MYWRGPGKRAMTVRYERRWLESLAFCSLAELSLYYLLWIKDEFVRTMEG